MKIMHLSDLHLGKRVNEFSMLEDQEYILKKILQAADEQQPEAVVIAGDVYDKSVPAAEAVSLFDDFLVRLAKSGLQVFVISGNHDSAERLSFASRLIDASGIHISPVYGGRVEPIVLSDSFGEVAFYMLPFVKPSNVRKAFPGEPDESFSSWTEALRTAVKAMDIDTSRRNVLIAHQFVTGAERSDSEELSIGGADNVDASVFEDFDYVALGHIHGPQNIGEGRMRYCGTPLKYSFSEIRHKKSVSFVTLGAKGELSLTTAELTPKHDMREIRGSYAELSAKKNYDGTQTDDYLHVTLTDEEDVPDALAKLRVIYPNIMKLDYDNARTRSAAFTETAADVENKTPLELFAEFYELQNGQPFSAEQSALTKELIEKIWGNAI